MMIEMKQFGFTEQAKMFADGAAQFLKAREYALASTGKMVREHVRQFGKQLTPPRNPFTGLIRQYTNGTVRAGDSLSERLSIEGSKKEAFHFASRMIARNGPASAKDISATVSRVRAREIMRQARIARRGYGRRSKYDESYRDGQGGYKKLLKRGEEGKPVFTRLINLLRFHVEPMIGRVSIALFPGGAGNGQTDPVIDQILTKNAQGYSVTVTERMRRFFFAIGFPTDRSTLTIPARPWFAPAYAQIKDRINEHFEKKFASAMMPFLRSGREVMAA